MSAETWQKPQDKFTYGLMVSAAFHASLFFLFLVRSLILAPENVENLSALRVDLVALPDKNPVLPPVAAPEETKTPPKPAEPVAPPPKTAVKPVEQKVPDAINLNKTKAALDKIKRMQALDKIKEDVTKDAADAERKRLEEVAAAARAKAGKLKGNILSPGSDLTGLDRLQHEQYRAAVDAHIKKFWELPEWLGRKKLLTKLIIKIDKQGHLLSKQVFKSSGNKDFDDAALSTIDRSNPLPAPPDKFISIAGVDGFLIEFGSDGN